MPFLVATPRRRAPLRASAFLSPIALLALAACSSGPGSRAESSSAAVTSASDAGVIEDAASDGFVPAPVTRNWRRHPVVREVDRAHEIWAVSDIHADYAAVTKLFAAAHLIDGVPERPRDVRWTGGRAVLVVVGDSIDRGPDAVDVLRMLIALQRSAEWWGGNVIVTMGNHEAEFLANPDNGAALDAAVGVDHELVEAGLSVDGTADGYDRIGTFLRDLPIAARVNDWFFVHAGNTQGQTTDEITSAVESGVDALGFGAPVLSASTSILETKFSTTSTIQWWNATGNPTSLLTEWTQALGVRHLVMGHQPQPVTILGGTNRPKDVMASEYGGLLFFIDTGLSIDVDATGGALLHVKHAGATTESWEEVMPDGSVRSL